MDLLALLIADWQTYVGIAAGITVLVNVFKLFKLVQDGDAKKWVAGLNLIGLIGFFVVKTWYPTVDMVTVDTQVGAFANMATVVIAYLGSLGLSEVFYKAVKGTPLIGKSFSG